MNAKLARRYLFSYSPGLLVLMLSITGCAGGLDDADSLAFESAQDADEDRIAEAKSALTGTPQRVIYSASNGPDLPGQLVRTEGSPLSGDAVVDAIYDNLGAAYDYYRLKHSRYSYDDNEAPLMATVHYGTSLGYTEASVDSVMQPFVFTDGDQLVYGPAIGYDVTVHHFAHAVTDTQSQLIPSGESGANREALADIFAAAAEAHQRGVVDANVWKYGEAIYTLNVPGDAIRYMNDPALGGQADHSSGIDPNAAIHVNAGIPSLAFYLMVMGGTHPRGKSSNIVAPLDALPIRSIEKAASLFYRADTTYLGPDSTLADMRLQTVQAAKDNYNEGSNEHMSVRNAWAAVGLTAGPCYNLDSTKIFVADFNGDKRADYMNPAGFMNVWLGNAEARLETYRTSFSGCVIMNCNQMLSGQTHIGDFNGDGRMDVFYRDYSGYMHRGRADGTFESAISLKSPYWSAGFNTFGSNQVYVGDFNGDGRSDLLIRNSNLTVHLGQANGTLSAPVETTNGCYGVACSQLDASRVHIGDFNGDGRDDMLVRGGNLDLFRGRADGKFDLPIATPGGCYGTSCSTLNASRVHIGDFNGDGRDDVLVRGGNLDLFRGRADGKFDAYISTTGGCYGTSCANLAADRVHFGDFNGDGRRDMMVRGGNLDVFLARADGKFEAYVGTPGGCYGVSCSTLNAGRVHIGDFNGDGRDDVLVRGGNNDVFRGRIDGRFEPYVGSAGGCYD